MRNAIFDNEADMLGDILDNGIDVNAPFVSVCIISIT